MSNEKRYLTSKEQEDLVVNNRKLVYYLVGRMGVPESDYEDMVSIGTIGLIKAASTFDDSKNVKFATYASMCINNEIFMVFRKNKKHTSDVSLDAPISTDSDGNELSLANLIPDPDSDCSRTVETNLVFERVINIILNLLKPKERLYMLYRIGGETQQNISIKLGCSQSYVSRIDKKINLKVKSLFSDVKQIKGDFSMKIVEDSYVITFSSKKINNFSKIFADFLLAISAIEDMPTFKVNCSKERFVIQLPADLQSFSVIAQIVEKIDDFSMTFGSNDTLNKVCNNEVEKQKSSKVQELPKAEINVEENEVIDIEHPKETSEKETEKSNEQIADSESSENDAKSVNKVKQIRDYMLKQTTFSSKELKQKFPEMEASAIGNAIYLAKKKGLIKKTGVRGEYIVEKKS